jgi:hypothetical protein
MVPVTPKIGPIKPMRESGEGVRRGRGEQRGCKKRKGGGREGECKERKQRTVESLVAKEKKISDRQTDRQTDRQIVR